jgi:DNA-binding transcriptional LysR family regulator
MDWNHLRVFLAVARHGQLLSAGKQLKLNHATVARRLDALEQALGTALVERRPSGCTVTEAGERLLPVAERIEFELLGIEERIRKEEAEVSGTVRVGAPDGLGNYFLAAELAQLAERHPDLIVELVPLPRTFSLSRREADLAIVLDQPVEGRLLVTRLVDYTLGVYAARAYLDEHGTPAALEDLKHHRVVSGVGDLAYASALDYAGALEKHARSVFRCGTVIGQTLAVASGAGTGILHDFIAAQFAELVPILPSIGYRRRYFLLSHPDTRAVRRISVVREFLLGKFRADRQRFAPFETTTGERQRVLPR